MSWLTTGAACSRPIEQRELEAAREAGDLVVDEAGVHVSHASIAGRSIGRRAGR